MSHSKMSERSVRDSHKKIFSSKEIEESIQTGKLFLETSNLEEANMYAEKAAEMAVKKAEEE